MKVKALDLESLILESGGHANPGEGFCVMEAVAYVAGEPHSDHPKCASPVLASFARRLNDCFNNDDRQLLKPLIPMLVGTATSDLELERRRMFLLVDRAVRVFAPMRLRARGYADDAAKLESLSPIVDRVSGLAARKVAAAAAGATASAAAAAATASAAYAYFAAAATAYAAAGATAAAAAYASAAAAAVQALRDAIEMPVTEGNRPGEFEGQSPSRSSAAH